MREAEQEQIAEDALLLVPFTKFLYRGDPKDPGLVPLRNQSYQVLRILQIHGPQPISAIGHHLFIAKQNMTTLVDRLVDDGLAERQHNTEDRRVIHIIVTEKGLRFLTESDQWLKGIIQKNLLQLSDEDIESLHGALGTIRTIMSKLKWGELCIKQSFHEKTSS
jgi:DNA-binding MarR family transcriptional regulator